MKLLRSFFILLVFCVLVSCKEKGTIEFDSRQPLALAPDVSWAVVSDPYAAFQSAPGWENSGSGHARKGEILQVQAKSIIAQKDSRPVVYENWYRFADGWLCETSVAIYSNRLKAETAVKHMDLN